MKFTNDQFEALAYIFEQENGNEKSDYEIMVIKESGLGKFSAKELESHIVTGLNNEIYKDLETRNGAYWALGKRFKKDLIPQFRKWLKKEFVTNEPIAVYQLLINLGNMDEPVFNPKRQGSSASYETELNMQDAEEYLKKTAHNTV